MNDIKAPPNWNAAPNDPKHRCDECEIKCEECSESGCLNDFDLNEKFHIDDEGFALCLVCYRNLQEEIEQENKKL